MANSRLNSRASFFTEVDVLSMGEAMPQRLWGENLSESGIFLQTTKPFHPGDRVSLRFDISENEVHVRAAEVVWVKPFEPINVDGTLPGIGVRFLSVDPPARAAIRRYVHTAAPAAENDDVSSDVPVPPAEPELPTQDFTSLESLRPLSMPPFDATPQPREIAADVSLPPDEPLANAPAAQRDTEHPLSGWRFEVVREDPDPSLSLDDVNDTLPPFSVSLPPFEASGEEARWDLPSMPPELLSEPPSEAVDAAPAEMPSREPKHDETRPYGLSFEEADAPAPSMSFSFDDDEPHASAQPTATTAPAKAASPKSARPPLPAPMTELPSEVFTSSLAPVEKEQRGPDVFELAAHARVDNEFFAGKLSVLELPQTEGRGLDPRATRKLRVAWAAGLLLAGGGLGVWMGYQPAPEQVASNAAETRQVTTYAAPKSVAEAEQQLFAAPAAAAPIAAKTTKTASNSAPIAAQTIPIVSPDEIATSKPGKLPRKEDVSLTNAVVPAAPAPPSVSASGGTHVEYGRVTVSLEGGRVARSFGLSNPPRVVVDLVDAKMPREKLEELGQKGVSRVRYGRPDPLHVRVVVELSGEQAPKDITTLKKGSTLSVAWR